MASKKFDVFLFVPNVPLEATANGVCTYARNLRHIFESDNEFEVKLVAKDVLNDADGEIGYCYYLKNTSILRKIILRAFGRDFYEKLVAWKFSRSVVKYANIGVVEMEEAFGHSMIIQKYVSMPVVVRLHGPWFLSGAGQGVEKNREYFERVEQEGKAIFSAAAVSSPSGFVLDAVENFYGKKIKKKIILPNPFPEISSKDRWIPSDKFRSIIFIGRLDLVKGGDIFVESMFKLSHIRKNMRSVFVGPDNGSLMSSDGVSRSKEEFVSWCEARYNIENPIDFVGKKNPVEVIGLRKNASVCVISSRVETFSYTTAESVAQGVPTVASCAGAIPEIISDGFNGLLFENEDVDGLIDCVVKILDNPKLAMRLSENALKTAAEKYSKNQLAIAYRNFYQEVIDERI